ncbi:MAG: hypothetical protein AAFQ67_07105 [Pseudomonadota bacterium]
MLLRYALLSIFGFVICVGITWTSIVQAGLDPFSQRMWPFLAIAALVGRYAPARIYQLYRWVQFRRVSTQDNRKSALATRMEARRARVEAAKASAGNQKTDASS